MAETTKTVTVRNVSNGIRGLNAVSGYVELAKGETREGVELSTAEYKSAEGTNYFAFGSEAEKEREAPPAPPAPPAGVAPTGGVPPVTPPPADDLDNLATDALADTVAAITGKDAPKQGARESDEAYRAKLLSLARGE